MIVSQALQAKLDATTVRGGVLAIVLSVLAGWLSFELDLAVPLWLLLLILVVFAWDFLATIALLVIARRGHAPMGASPFLWGWIGARFAIYFALISLFLIWLVTLPIGSPWSAVSGRALISLLLVSAIVSRCGQAVVNSLLVVRTLLRKS